MSNPRWLAVCAVAAMTLVAASALAQDSGLGKKRGNGGSGSGGGSGGGSNTPPPPPPRRDPPPRIDPPAQRGDSGRGSGSSGGGSRDTGSPRDSGGRRDPGRGGGSSDGGSGGSSSGDASPSQAPVNRPVIIDQGQGGLRTRPSSSRSGTVRYGSVSNSITPTGPIDLRTAPVDLGIRIGDRVNRQENVRVNYGGIRNGVRVGYYHYDRRWRDDNFAYPYYVFNPFSGANCVVSPWYFYPSLPGYLSPTRVIYVNTFPTYWEGDVYRWNYRPNRDDDDRYDRSRSAALDDALDDIVSAFQGRDQNSVDRLVPKRGNVNIYTDGRYQYSLNGDDFYDLYNDGIESNRTRRYEILEVRANGSKSAKVQARHEYTDPWGRVSVVYHTYYLERDRRSFVIREFGTSSSRGW